MRKRYGKGLLCLAALALVLLPTVAPAAISIVRAQGEDWDPAVRRIVRGTTVTWRNPTDKVHDVSSYGGNWTYARLLQPGERASRTFKSVGRFKYRCKRHSAMIDGACKGMCGVIRVRAPS
jgi:plastocyanin